MKHLGKAIDAILAIEPDLCGQLLPIKGKWERYPSREMKYWKDLLTVLNSSEMLQHPKREQIKGVLVPKRKPETRTSFEDAPPNESVVGVIPEPIADKIRKYDRQTIDLSVRHMKARMTHDIAQIPLLLRTNERIDLQKRNLWFKIKDHFDLWQWDMTTSFFIRKKNGVLVLTVRKDGGGQAPSGPEGQGGPFVGLIKMDPDTLRNFFRQMGLEPPPGLFGTDE